MSLAFTYIKLFSVPNHSSPEKNKIREKGLNWAELKKETDEKTIEKSGERDNDACMFAQSRA